MTTLYANNNNNNNNRLYLQRVKNINIYKWYSSMKPVLENPYLTQALLLGIGVNNFSGMYMVWHLKTLKYF